MRPLSYIHDTELELEMELVVLVDETPSTPVNSKLAAKIKNITGKMGIIIFLHFIYFLKVLAGSYYPFLVILPLCKALATLNAHLDNSVYEYRTNFTEGNPRVEKVALYRKR